MSILSLIILALIGEAVWETLKMCWQNGKISTDRIGALVIGLLLALGSGLDLLAMVGVPLHISYVGMILTGLLISRGANFMHDILGSINNVQANTKFVPDTETSTEIIKPSKEFNEPVAEKPIDIDIKELHEK